MTWLGKINKPSAIVTVLLLIAVAVLLANAKFEFRTPPEARNIMAGQDSSAPPQKGIQAQLPKDSDFKTVAESDALRLKMDAGTGHFIVEDKRNNNVFRSYPDPQYWAQEKISENWKKHLASPLMVQYVDFSKSILQAKETNIPAESGKVKDVRTIPGGFALTYEFPETGFTIPVEVKIEKDYVETKVVREGIKETKMGLVWVRLFPFFGAEYSAGQDGYMLIPDGAGALIRFKDNQLNVNKLYDESVYGQDNTFAGLSNNRNKIIMPVFGMKTGSKGFLAVLQDGEEYANVVASPSGVLSGYNWITTTMNFRSSFLQFTSRNSPDEWGFVDYNKNELFGSDRVVRYYILGSEQADYVGMAQKYRDYLMNEKGVQRTSAKNADLPMHVDIIGGDREKGIVTDRYIPLTSTGEATEMVHSLYDKGIRNMSLMFMGWQKDGYSSFGESLPADPRVGGDKGMKAFIADAHSKGFPVYLDTEYGMNNTGAGGFDEKFHAVVNLAGRKLNLNPLYNNARVPVTSDKFAAEMVSKQLAAYKELGVDGLGVNRIGQRLFSDYNSSYGSHRDEARDVQESILKNIKETLGGVIGNQSSFYALPEINHIQNLVYDHSYDLFTDEAVPFAQIAAHGLITYSSEYVNNRQEDINDFLRDIEYGAAPSFVFTRAETKEFVNAYGIRYYNTHFADWADMAAEQYKQYNEALGDVQNQFITSHRTIAPNVKETTYENGKRIVVNYGIEPYRSEGMEVPAQNFVVIQGGAGR
ncbi:DUF5696 domain-containing protein [Paenibacillus doosanensis]|uniref:DUF5696 domain-containing protein n=1 Tax=Paenibacillus doosanensis TaxID=1229154 RepID=UPI00217F2C53|nr:DUF5696 domain-containing protein [Paenibacillus doosanensis]MCS7459776.1 DUF5696 domain-containing protein [Paenibacillus doosanensis]